MKAHLGFGLRTSIYTWGPRMTSSWLSLSSPTTPMGPPIKQSQFMTVNQLICPISKTWDRGKLSMLLLSYEMKILSLRPRSLGAPDRYAWLSTKSGEYSSKVGYHAASISSEKEPHSVDPLFGFDWNKEIWNKQCLAKVKFVLW